MKEILKYLGNYGKYQIYIFCIMFLPSFMSGALTLISTFTQGVPNTRCYIPGYDSSSTSYDSPFNDNISDYLLLSSKKDASGNVYCWYCNPNNTLANGIPCTDNYAQKCTQYVYDTSQLSIKSAPYKSLPKLVPSLFDLQFNMVCDDDWKATLIQSLFMVGVLIGSGVFGIIGDKFGRRVAFLIAALSQIVVLNVVPLAVNFYAYCVLQILVGGLQQACYFTGFIVVMELFDGIPKTIFGIAAQGFFAFAYYYLGIMAYFVRNWQILQYTVSALSLLYIPYYWLLPESIRWLILNNKEEEAKRVIQNAAKWNGVIIPDTVIENELASVQQQFKHTNNQANVWDLYKDRRMGIVTSIVFFTWMVCTLTYYGLSWNTSWLPGNNYLDFMLSGTVEIISYILSMPIMEYFGRRWSLVAYFGIGGLGCIISGISSQKAVVITFSMLGKFCVSAAFGVTYNYTAEIFPTALRNSGIGFSSLVGRIGSIAAPQIALLFNVAYWIPSVTYGIFGIAASVLDFFLPETKNEDIGETLEDGVNFLNRKKNKNGDENSLHF